jgi:hypothetical protein
MVTAEHGTSRRAKLDCYFSCAHRRPELKKRCITFRRPATPIRRARLDWVRQDRTHSLWDAARSPLLLLVKPIALSSLLGVTRFLPLHVAPMTLKACRVGRVAFTDVTADARDTGEKPPQSQLDRCLSVNLFHAENRTI